MGGRSEGFNVSMLSDFSLNEFLSAQRKFPIFFWDKNNEKTGEEKGILSFHSVWPKCDVHGHSSPRVGRLRAFL